ncbi:transposase [Planctomycetaceae bacterium SH139]
MGAIASRIRRTRLSWLHSGSLEPALRRRAGVGRLAAGNPEVLNPNAALMVCDNLNTHTIGAFYEAFEPSRARALVSRIESHYTPKHGVWLNIAENELRPDKSDLDQGQS